MLIPVLNTIISILGMILSILYFYQIAYLFIPLIFKRKRPPEATKNNHFAILIAARNEEAVLPHLLKSIRAQDYPADKITTFVIADNCTDQTARIAREGGAVVYERFNKEKVGKGYALNYLLDRVREDYGYDAFDQYMIFDADNLLLPDYFTQMNKTCCQGYAAYSGYRNTKNFGDNWISSGYGVWYLHDSVHMNMSRSIIHANCAVNGTGFGFTRELLKEMGNWNFFTLTEDLEFSLWCTTHGHRIGYCHEAMLFDEQPNTFRQSWRQRTRWSQGGIQIVLKYTGDLIRGLFKGGWISYSTYETTTLSFWGMSLGVLCGVLTVITTFLAAGIWTTLAALGIGILTTFFTMAGIGALTLATEWKNIRATTTQKLLGILGYPLYILTWIPISLQAGFRKFQWTPIEHTVAVSHESLEAPTTKEKAK